MSEEKKDEQQTKAAPAEENKAEKEAETPANKEEAQEETATPSTQEDADKAPVEESEQGAEEKEEEKPEVKELPNRHVKPGMIVRVHEIIIDVNARGEEKTRIQVFEGVVLGVKGAGVSKTMTVRKNSNGYIVEKIYPLASPNIEKIEVVKEHRTRRAKLNYLRKRFRRKMQERAQLETE